MIVLYTDPLGMFPVYHLDFRAIHLLHIGNLIATVALVAYLAHYYSKGVNDSERQLQKLTEAYKELATYDSLTRLLNRHAMMQAIEDEVSRFRRFKKPFVLALGDIDDFKNIDDRFGHHTGDVLLKEFALCMQQRLLSARASTVMRRVSRKPFNFPTRRCTRASVAAKTGWYWQGANRSNCQPSC